jgi:hypothetical protein
MPTGCKSEYLRSYLALGSWLCRFCCFLELSRIPGGLSKRQSAMGLSKGYAGQAHTISNCVPKMDARTNSAIVADYAVRVWMTSFVDD